jgi:hypothetical protein
MEKAFALRKYGIVSSTIMADTNNKISQMNITEFRLHYGM